MKTKKSYNYWLKRQDERLAYSERISNETIAQIMNVYNDSLQRVEKRIDNIIKNYSQSIQMPSDQLKALLSEHDKQKLLEDLQQDLIKNGANTNANMTWLRGNYLKRLTDQESIKSQLENERRIIASHEKSLSTLGYKNTIERTYLSMTRDLTGQTKHLSESAKNSLLNQRWVSSKNYSKRIWDNTGKLSNDVNKLINSSLISGTSRNDIINDLKERYDVARYRAEVLVRTEMNYFENQSELKSYQDAGIEHYIYIATRDSRTSAICSGLDNQRFAVKDAQAGLNYPPMHPNCRSTTVPDLDFVDDYRVYKNPITGLREKTTKSYEDWLSDIEEKAESKYNIDRDRITSKYDRNTFAETHQMRDIDLVQSLELDEISLIQSYSRDLYQDLNRYLRGEFEFAPDIFKINARKLNNALKRHELKEDALLRRGVSGVTIERMGIKGLGEVQLRGFTSTTINPNISMLFMHKQPKKVYMEFLAPKGTKGLYISNLAEYGSEQEFLLPHNTRINVESIKEKEGYTHVKARIIV
ncbi:minor capsid protein [Erysipelothrix rhusiopathiae]|uniref:minor capsid protein n=1 Tax=Erysipelothrix rhusiopathiae TaxID=1648 RepID=UPI002B2476EF|nr:minor capsid protein [Erysipelothrix rhusiopathiae]WRB92630.1 minor capsid protein [Erysipelothrix rhusiopathiae]